MTEAIHAQLETAHQAMAGGRAIEARNAYARAAALSREVGAHLLQARSLAHLAEIDLAARRPDAALAHADQAAALYRAHDGWTALDLARVLRLAARSLDALRHTSEAALRWHQAHELFRAAGDTAAVAECENRLAEDDR